MARSRTSYISNMARGEVADDTRMIERITSDEIVLDAVDRYDKYIAEFEGWIEEEGNEGQPITVFEEVWEEKNKHKVPEFAAVADRGNITDAEALFVEVRFFMEHSNGSPREKINASWCQMNTINIPGMTAGDLAIFVKVYNARRTYLGLDPV